MPLEVLLLTWDFPPSRGGIQTWMYRIARELPDARVRVLAPAVPGGGAFDAASGLDIRRLHSARLGRLLWLAELTLRVVAICVLRRPNWILCGHVVAAPAALLAHTLTRVPYAVFVYGFEIRRRTHRRLFARLLRPARLVLACSEFTQSLVLALGISAARVRILYPGVDAERFGPDPRPRTAGPRVGNGAATLLTVGRLGEPYKGHDTAIRALPLVRGKVPGARLRIVGEGPLRAYLTRLAASLDVDTKLRFTGEVSDERLPEVYRGADVLLVLGRDSPADGGAEGFGIVCLEAAACGVPVVAGRSGGLPDAVEDGVTGLLVDPTDLAACAGAIVSLLEDPARARAMGEAGRRRVVARFTWTQVLAEARRVLGGVGD